MMNADQRILIAADDESFAMHLRDNLRKMGYTVSAVVSDWHEAEHVAGDVRPDAALVDVGLLGDAVAPGVADLLNRRLDVPVVYITDVAEGDLFERAHAANPYAYVIRPFDDHQLHLSIQAAVSIHNRELELLKTQIRLERKIDEYKHRAELMETVFNSMSEGVVAIDKDGAILFHNSSGPRIAGAYPPEQDISKWTQKYGVFHSDGRTVLTEDVNPLTLAIKGKATEEIELQIRNEQRPEGVHISVSARPLEDKTGSPKGGVAVIRDITRLKRAEAELEQSISQQQSQAQLMETVFNSMSEGVVAVDEKGQVIFANSGARRIAGDYPPEEDAGRWAERYGVFQADGKTPFPLDRNPLHSALKGEPVDEVEAFIRNDQKPEGVYIRMSARPLLDNLGEIGGGVVIFRDVTERVLAEEALARAFDQGRLEMVDTILHNIGNAINSVTTGIETVRRNLTNDRAGRRLFALARAIDAHRSDWIDYISNDPQGRKVMPFIIKLAEDFGRRNDELMKTVSRVRDRANRIADIIRTQKALDGSDMDSKDIDLYDALAGSLRVLKESLARRGIRTDVNCEDAPQQIRVRESQFHQMLVNLVKNSIEAIDEHAVLFGLQETPSIRIEASDVDGYLNLEVIDNGIGIEHKDTRVLFTPGYTTKKSGSGLGLHSAANFVIACGGRIEPCSEGKGNGTTMRVMLPLTAVAPRLDTG